MRESAWQEANKLIVKLLLLKRRALKPGGAAPAAMLIGMTRRGKSRAAAR